MRIGWMGALAALAVAASPLTGSAQPRPTDPQLPERSVQVAPHVYVMAGWPNVGIIVGETGTLVVDTGLGAPMGQRVATEAQRLSTKGQKLYLTTTHFHPEHASGQAGFPAGTIVIRPRVQQTELEASGAAMVRSFAARSPEFGALLAGPQVTHADVVFDTAYKLDLGGVTVGIYVFGSGHTTGDTIIFDEQDSVVFPGDIIESQRSPNIGCATCSPRSWIGILDKIAALNPAHVVPTHGVSWVGPEWIAKEKTFLTEVDTRAMALKAQGKTAQEAGVIVTAEMRAKYPDWTGLENLGGSVARAYANSP